MTPGGERLAQIVDTTDSPVFLLCDWAEVVNGKLYIGGGGFSQVLAGSPVSLSLALLIYVRWHETNKPRHIRIALLDEDGEALKDAEGQPFSITGDIEMGRPPGTKPGSVFPAPLAFRLPPMVLPLGGYRFELHIDDVIRSSASFQAVGGQ